LRDAKRLSLQTALMAMSAWVLGSLLLGSDYSVVGIGGIVVLLVTLVVVRVVAPMLDPD
jgi:hypothetical protein